MPTKAEAQATEQFGDRYRLCCTPPMAAAELDVLGADYGSSGYTTLTQAADIGARLCLSPDDRLADIGAGSGWPGLYLCQRTGCRVVGTDLPIGGLRRAQTRAGADGLIGRAAYARATGLRQPFRSGSFDAAIHTDVLCCLVPKLSVLRECRRLLRPGGRLAFTSIFVRPGLDARQRRRAHATGPVFVAARHPYPALLGQAGFIDTVEVDLTPEYEQTHRTWLEATEQRADELRLVMADDEFAQGQADRRRALESIQDGLLGRSLFLAVRP